MLLDFPTEFWNELPTGKCEKRGFKNEEQNAKTFF